jgi:hypothetical protein
LFALRAPRDSGGVPGDLLFGTQRQPPLNEKEAVMAASRNSADCPFDEPYNTTDVDGINWDVQLMRMSTPTGPTVIIGFGPTPKAQFVFEHA